MSVNYITQIGLGYIVTSEEKDHILNHCLATADLEDEFLCLDCYTSDSLYFLGEKIESIDEGCFSVTNLEHLYEESRYKEIEDKYGMFLEYLEKDTKPKLYVLNMVW